MGITEDKKGGGSSDLAFGEMIDLLFMNVDRYKPQQTN